MKSYGTSLSFPTSLSDPESLFGSVSLADFELKHCLLFVLDVGAGDTAVEERLSFIHSLVTFDHDDFGFIETDQSLRLTDTNILVVFAKNEVTLNHPEGEFVGVSTTDLSTITTGTAYTDLETLANPSAADPQYLDGVLHICRDGSGSLALAADLAGDDPPFAAGGDLLCYVLGKSAWEDDSAANPANLVVDFWYPGKSLYEDSEETIPNSSLPLLRLPGVTGFDASGDPIIGPGDLTAFDENDDGSIRAFMVQLMKNLEEVPKFLGVSPPVETWRKDCEEIRLHFSKPLLTGEARDTGRFTIDPATSAWNDSVDHFAATYFPTTNGANTVVLNAFQDIGNTPVSPTIHEAGDTQAELTFDVTVSTPASTWSEAATEADIKLEWFADLTAPSVTLTPNHNPLSGVDLSIGLSYSHSQTDGSGITSAIAKISIQTDGTTDKPDTAAWTRITAGDTPPTNVDIPLPAYNPSDPGFDANPLICVWVEDEAGNCSTVVAPAVGDTIGTGSVIVNRVAGPSISGQSQDFAIHQPGTLDVQFTVSAPAGKGDWRIYSDEAEDPAFDTTGTSTVDPGPYAYSVNYTFPVSTLDGNDKSLTIEVRDNCGTPTSYTFPSVTLDRHPPSFEIDDLDETVVYQAAMTIPLLSGDDSHEVSPGSTVAGSGVIGYALSTSSPPTDVASWEALETGSNPPTWQSWTGGSATIPYNCGPDEGSKAIHVWVRDQAWNVTDQVVNFNYRYPRKIFLVADCSGSMNDPASVDPQGSSFPLDSDDYSKWFILQKSVEWFGNLLEIWDSSRGIIGPHDEIGLILFSNHVATALPLTPILVDEGEESGIDQINEILGNINSIPDANLTAMGAGLGKALDALNYHVPESTTGVRRAVLLITDGIQNRDPVLKADGPSGGDISVDIEETGSEGPNTFEASMDYDTFANDLDTGYPGNNFTEEFHYSSGGLNRNVQVHTLAIGDAQAWQEKLALASQASFGGGQFVATPAGFDGVNTFFTDIFSRIWEDNTPQIVFRSRNILSGPILTKQSFQFHLNSSVKSMAVVVSWLGDVDFKAVLKQGDTRVIPRKARILSQSGVTVVDFPHMKVSMPPFPWEFGFPKKALTMGKIEEWQWKPGVPDDFQSLFITPGGEWTLDVYPANPLPSGKRDFSVPLFVAVMVEDEAMKIRWDHNLPGIFHEKDIPCRILLDRGGFGSWSKPSIRAVLSGPAHDPYALLNRIPDDLKQRILRRIQSDQKKGIQSATIFSHLREEAKRKPTAQLTRLISMLDEKSHRNVAFRGSQKRGSYNYQSWISRPSEPGIYSLDVSIKVNSSKGGIIERCMSRSYLVPFNASSKNSVVQTSPGSGSVILEPKDEKGTKLGPGFTEEINPRLLRSLGVEEEIQKVVDLADGRYEVTIKPKRPGQKRVKK